MTAKLSFEQIKELIKPVRGPDGRGTSDADVVIVGAGPIGLTAANVLGTLGISTLLIEQSDLTSDSPRALAVDDEYMRLLDNVGILPSLLEHTSPPFGIHFVSALGPPIVKVPAFVTPNGFGTRTGIMQPVFEKSLLEAAQKFACVDVQYRSTVTSVKQDGEGVRVTVRTPGGERCVSARFLLGCDGARSVVRSQVGIAFEGTRIDEPHLVIDLAEFPDQAPYSRFFCNPERPLNSIPTPYGGRRLEFMLNPEDSRETIVSKESIRSLLDRNSPYRGVEAKVIRAVVYGFSERIAHRLQAGRVFLLGDAAHVMPPFGAQAMNTGARDVNNICWKIAVVLSGRAAPALLDTYESERRPQIEAIIRYSVMIGKLANLRSWPTALLRDATLWVLNCIPPVRRFFSEMRYMPRPRLGRGFLARQSNRKDSLVGRVFPRITLVTRDNRVLSIDALVENHFALVGVGLTTAQMRKCAGHPLCRLLDTKFVVIGLGDHASPDADGIYGARLSAAEMQKFIVRHAGDILLVRPDRYVAAAANPKIIERVLDQLQQTFASSQQSASSTTV
jgi:3-(3-hydroxy-phenyl)propionate hydroxylase